MSQGSEMQRPEEHAGSTDQQPPAEPPSILRLKDEYVAPEHEELVTLATGSNFQSPPQNPPPPPPRESPPHPSLRQQMSPSFNFAGSSETPPETQPRPSFLQVHPSSQLLSLPSHFSQFFSRSSEPQRLLALPSSQGNSTFILQLPFRPPLEPLISQLHPSLLLPSSSSHYIEPPPRFHVSMPPSSSFSRSSEPPPASPHPLTRHSSRSLLQPPFLQALAPSVSLPHPSLSLPSSSSQYIEPAPGFHFSMPSPSRQLFTGNFSTLNSPAQLPPWPPLELDQSLESHAHLSRASRARIYKKLTIEPPYPWASTIRAKVLSMQELISKNIIVISGDVYCKECKKEFRIEYDLRSKFPQVVNFIAGTVRSMDYRATKVWPKPEGLNCRFCNKSKCVQPAISLKKRNTNWLFLFLGQMIGYCNLTHLKYFCKHNNHPKYWAKDRLVYLAYITLHCQLDPRTYDLHDNN